MLVTRNLNHYVNEKGFNISEIARKTGVPYGKIRRSIGLKEPQRELRADELAQICAFLEVNPMDFWKAQSPPG